MMTITICLSDDDSSDCSYYVLYIDTLLEVMIHSLFIDDDLCCWYGVIVIVIEVVSVHSLVVPLCICSFIWWWLLLFLRDCSTWRRYSMISIILLFEMFCHYHYNLLVLREMTLLFYSVIQWRADDCEADDIRYVEIWWWYMSTAQRSAGQPLWQLAAGYRRS